MASVGGIRRGADAEAPDAPLAERPHVRQRDSRRRLERQPLAAAFDVEVQRQAGAHRRDAPQILEAVDLLAIDGENDVARLDARLRGWRACQHAANPGGQCVLTHDREGCGEDQDRENEIGDRAGGDDHRAIDHGLAGQRAAPLRLRHPPDALVVRGAGDVGVPMEFHVAAERKGGEAPPRAMAVDAGVEFGAEAEGERVDLHAAPAAHQIMTKLVEEHDHADDHGERHDIPADRAQQAANITQQNHL
jgi:hypothetical protein